jgi:hypothetical protein
MKTLNVKIGGFKFEAEIVHEGWYKKKCKHLGVWSDFAHLKI